MGTELTRRLISMRAEIEENGAMWGGTKDNLYKRIDQCIALSKQPPVYAMSGEPGPYYQESLDRSGIRMEYRESDNRFYAYRNGELLWSGDAWFNAVNIALHLTGSQCCIPAPSPQAVTVEGRWISVDERLPEMGEAVIVYPHPHICRYGPWEYYGVEQVAGFHSWDDRNDTDSLVPGVTHWMPIPSAPSSTNT